ncbi:bifunctional UDP-N-acetylglucosamine diphosphorylase/glucosamine-1-phosphate N-acetyltransferase GlmU [Maridesulfovibrio bastinii]|uniref:bifunctional UDP-N-acetylglucosamine diphosphorylase/glucosamine-1-phosphate N-acetyltransferase GlmU n=1 Tax=Maridesulfovibrio bastinii TaxID=47157 RepID=UPI0003F85C89|nr:bifunctional UDP-N-acetylglucosamine diphosphorylase/glucosamine-1-phosphate N-acetyltransferase GlmU [Maridesulfovibrio bastinii]
MTDFSACALVLAAGKGTRMYSDKPKVLRTLLGEPMLHYVYSALDTVFEDKIYTVVGFGAEHVEAAFPDYKSGFVLQKEQLGTGHALQTAWSSVQESGCEYCFIINGDTPLVNKVTVLDFLDAAVKDKTDLSFLTITPDEENQFGRVIRDKDLKVKAIVEAKDYDESVYGPPSGEVNAGIYCLKVSAIDGLLSRLNNENKSGEYYITDLVDLAVESEMNVTAVNCGNSIDLMGINTPYELSKAESALRFKIVDDLLRQGVVVHNCECAAVGPKAEIAPGAEITGPCEIFGKSVISSGCLVESNVFMRDAFIAEGAVIHSFSHIEKSEVGVGCSVGPYGRLRPGAVLEEGSKVGNFVEVKKSRLGKGVKASHLTYLGDSEIGAGTNVGAGTITCNYDGKNKFKTIIGENVFIGSNTAIVAPVEVGAGALIGAGSTITKKIGENELAVARGKQVNIRRHTEKS